MVRVINGANNDEFAIAGKTVGEVRKAFASLFNITAGTQATVNGRNAADSVVLADGDELAFTKQVAKKG